MWYVFSVQFQNKLLQEANVNFLKNSDITCQWQTLRHSNRMLVMAKNVEKTKVTILFWRYWRAPSNEELNICYSNITANSKVRFEKHASLPEIGSAAIRAWPSHQTCFPVAWFTTVYPILQVLLIRTDIVQTAQYFVCSDCNRPEIRTIRCHAKYGNGQAHTQP